MGNPPALVLHLARGLARPDRRGQGDGSGRRALPAEDELTQKLVAALKVHLATEAPCRRRPPTVPAGPAQTDYVVALGYLELRRRVSVQQAIDVLKRIPGGEVPALVPAAWAGPISRGIRTHNIAFARLAQAAARAAKLDPGRAETLLTLGRIQRLGRFAEAIRSSAALSRATPRPRRPCSTSETRSRTPETATTRKPRSVARPSCARPYWAPQNRLGRFYAKGDYGLAITAYEEAARLNPSSARPLSNLCGPTSRRTAGTPSASRKSDRARAEPERLVESGPPTTRARPGSGGGVAKSGRRGAETLHAVGGARRRPPVGPRRSGTRACRVPGVVAPPGDRLNVNPRDAAALRNRATRAHLGDEARAVGVILAARSAAPDDSTVLVESRDARAQRKERATRPSPSRPSGEGVQPVAPSGPTPSSAP